MKNLAQINSETKDKIKELPDHLSIIINIIVILIILFQETRGHIVSSQYSIE